MTDEQGRQMKDIEQALAIARKCLAGLRGLGFSASSVHIGHHMTREDVATVASATKGTVISLPGSTEGRRFDSNMMPVESIGAFSEEYPEQASESARE